MYVVRIPGVASFLHPIQIMRPLHQFLIVCILLLTPLAQAQQAAKQTAAKQTAAAALVHYLEREGVTKVFGVPGEETLHLVDALRSSRKIQFVLSGNEQGASMMATGYARATGKMGVALSTLGPGATNLVTGTANAMSENVRLLVITGQGPVKRPVGYHQKLPLTDLFKPVTRLSLEAKRGSSVVATARKLVRAANQNPGPVHLSLPSDVAARQIKVVKPQPAVPVRRPRPGTMAVASAAKLLKDAKFPVIVAGDGVLQERQGHTARGVLAFAKLHNIPVVPSAIAKGMFPSNNELVLPPLGPFSKGKGAELVRKADLILSVGFHPTEVFEPQSFNPGGKTKMVHLSTQKLPAEHRIKGMNPQVELTSGLVQSLGALHSKLRGYHAPATAATEALKLRAQHDQELASYMGAKGKAPLRPQQVMGELRKALDGKGKAMVFGDVGLNKGMLHQWMPVSRPGEVMVPNGMSTMGVALPAAIGAKLARPGLKVLSLSGDGGLMMNVQELSTAAKYKLPLVHVVLIDRKLGLIENHQRRNGLKPSGVDVASFDVKSLAKGMGARGYMVKQASQIAPLVRRSFKANRPTLIGIPVDYSESHAAADRIGATARQAARPRAVPRATTLRTRPTGRRR